MIAEISRQVISDFHAFRLRVQERGWIAALEEISSPDTKGSWQVIKYLIIGFLSIFVFYASYGFFRACVEIAQPGAFIRDRLLWNMLGILAAFIPTNFFTYRTNKRWVFKGGRHEQEKEFFLFTLVAASSFTVCQVAVWLLIQYSPVNDFLVTLCVIALSTLINYLFRKFVIFHG